MATMEERDDRGRKTAKRDDDGREKDKAQLLSLQQHWERERETHGPIVIHKEEGGEGVKTSSSLHSHAQINLPSESL